MPTRIKTALSALAAFGALAACQAEPAGPTVLIVGASDPPEAPGEGLYGNFGVALVGAHRFTLSDLHALPPRRVTVRFPLEGPSRTYSGPALSAVLAAAGSPGAGARVTALDGYQVDIPADAIATHEPILALATDEEPLAVGGYGPTMLVWPRDTEPALADMTDDLWPWGVFAIAALASDQD